MAAAWADASASDGQADTSMATGAGAGAGAGAGGGGGRSNPSTDDILGAAVVAWLAQVAPLGSPCAGSSSMAVLFRFPGVAASTLRPAWVAPPAAALVAPTGGFEVDAAGGWACLFLPPTSTSWHSSSSSADRSRQVSSGSTLPYSRRQPGHWFLQSSLHRSKQKRQTWYLQVCVRGGRTSAGR